MRRELRDAVIGLVEHADLHRVNRALAPSERNQLIRLATYTARARTAVVRDGYGQNVSFLPQVEGPGRLVKAYARLLGGLEVIGCESDQAWATLRRIAIDCAPALRTKVIRELVKQSSRARTSDVASAIETVTKTASRYLEDLSILGLADHSKTSQADNAPDSWQASDWLRDYWPETRTEKYVPTDQTQFDVEKDNETETKKEYPTSQSHFQQRDVAPPRTSQSHSAEADDLPDCL